MLSRTAVVGGALIAMTLLTVAPGRAAIESGPGEARITYIASVEGSWVGCCDTPAGRVAPTGIFHVYPLGRSFTFSIDDFGTLDGARVAVYVSGNGLYFNGCMPVRTTTTFTGHSAGGDILVALGATRLAEDFPCPATAGVVTVTGVV